MKKEKINIPLPTPFQKLDTRVHNAITVRLGVAVVVERRVVQLKT